jgi:inner membrane protein
VDNITHSLVGVALADLAMGRRASKAQRPLLVGAGVIAANLPDIDVAYAAITSAPLGYLLHHRGHTHTVAGLVGLALVLALSYWFFPAVRKLGLADRLRFWCLVAVALASHLALDSLNSYGIHPFHPFETRWYFGDLLFILEPALWLVLGVAVSLNSRTGAARLSVALPIVLLLIATASMGVIPVEAAGVLAVIGAAFGWVVFRLSPGGRAALAFALCGVIVAGLAGASRLARTAAVEALRPELRGQVMDVVLTPNPSSPLCWAVIAIERRDTAGEYILWRGTLSLAPAWKPPTACASHRLAGGAGARVIGDGRLAMRSVVRQPLQRLRTLAEGDCWVRAWLRFGRAPVIDGGAIFDLRFAERFGQNFSQMRLGTRGTCPSFVPGWAMPRADLLE